MRERGGMGEVSSFLSYWKKKFINRLYVCSTKQNQPSDTGRITSSGSGKYEQKSTVSRFTKPEVK